MMLFIHRQYTASRARSWPSGRTSSSRRLRREERVVVPIPGVTRAVIQAINVARSIDDDVRAVYITEEPESAAQVRADFERQIPGVPLVVVESPYRALVGPLLAYLDVLDAAWPPDQEPPITFVVIPEYVARHWWERILYNQAAKRLRAGPARPAADGRRQRPVPARGSRRCSTRRWAASTNPTDGARSRATAPAERRWYRDKPCPMPNATPTSASSSPSTAAPATRGSSAWPPTRRATARPN